VLVAGGSTPGYDGVNFFATTHNEGVTGNQANTNTGTGTSLAQIRADFITARTGMRRLKDDQGRVMNIQPDLVIIPPDLQDVFEQLINTNIIALSSGTQQSNVLQGAVEIFVDSYLTDANDWFLLSTKNVVKPLIFQQRKAPEFVSITNPDADSVFMTRMFKYGVDARFAVGYGLWQMIQRVTN
jgi:phage major head subunit gpT-like protein